GHLPRPQQPELAVERARQAGQPEPGGGSKFMHISGAMVRFRRGCGVMVATLAGAGALQAQSLLKGSVRADSTRRPIAGAEVLLQPLGRSARTDAEGEFRLADLPAGKLSVVVRAIGYRALGAKAELGPHGTLDVVFALSTLPVQLAPI